jgi:type I restriction enzyme S subunit
MNKKKIRISDIATLNENTLSSKDKIVNIKYLDTGNITRNKIDKIQEMDARTAKLPSRAKRIVKSKTILYSTVRPDQEHYGYMVNPDNNLIVSTGFTTIDIIDKSVDSKFLYYLLIQGRVTEYLHNLGMNGVSSYPSIKPQDIGNLIFDIPENIQDQKQIAVTLSNIDAKIELNNKINDELEKMAKALYDYWFVQFDFPDENGNPYKSSGGEMVWNDELKREIPINWKVENLIENSMTELLKPGIESFKGRKRYLATSDVVGANINFQVNFINHANRESRANMQPVSNSVWFAKMKNSKKTIFIGEYSKYLIDNFILSTGFAGIRCMNEHALEYIWGCINSDFFETLKDRLSNGATQEAINNDSMKLIPLLKPTDDVLKKYHELTHQMHRTMYLHEIESKKLTDLRDWLLPMLMNGQVTVK